MKKRAIAWLMAAAMVLSLAGCGGGNEEQIIGQDIEIKNVPGPITEINEAGEAMEMDGPGSQGWLELSKRKPDGLTIGVADLPGFSDSLARQAGTRNRKRSRRPHRPRRRRLTPSPGSRRTRSR